MINTMEMSFFIISASLPVSFAEIAPISIKVGPIATPTEPDNDCTADIPAVFTFNSCAKENAFPKATDSPNPLKPKYVNVTISAAVRAMAPDLGTDSLNIIKQINKLNIGNKDKIVIII